MHNNSGGFSLAGRMRSVGHALRGIVELILSQHNAWIHAVATVVVVALGIYVNLGNIEWALVVFAIVLVWMAEAANTAIEFLCDVASPEFHPLVKKAKDIAAASVLLAAVGAVFIAFFVFAPHLS